MLDIANRQQFSGRDRLDGSANQNSVHHHIVANREISHGELMFCGNIFEESIGLAFELDSFAGFQVGEGNQDIVAGIELEHVEMHRSVQARLL